MNGNLEGNRPLGRVSRPWIMVSWLLAALVAAVSAAGLWWDGIYRWETLSWATQGRAQDAVDLFLVVPLFLLGVNGLRRGSIRWYLIWLGLLMYLVYSFVLYAFFVHFGPLFLPYVATLGLSSYALAVQLARVNPEAWADRVGPEAPTVFASRLMWGVAALFYTLWLGEVLSAAWGGRMPPSVIEGGMPVNPIHVLDMAILLPALIAVGWQVRWRRPWGWVLTVPLLVFLSVMGVAVLAMMAWMRAQGIGGAWGPGFAIIAITSLSAYLIVRFVSAVKEA